MLLGTLLPHSSFLIPIVLGILRLSMILICLPSQHQNIIYGARYPSGLLMVNVNSIQHVLIQHVLVPLSAYSSHLSLAEALR